MQGIVIEGLDELRRDLRWASANAPRELSAAIRAAGRPLIERIRPRLPYKSGDLQRSLYPSVQNNAGYIRSRELYAGGAEWGVHGKWQGWVRKYGPPPRFVWPGVEAYGDELMEDLSEALRELLTAREWFRGW